MPQVILSKREKMIAYVTSTAIGLFLLDYIAVEPLMAHRQQLVEKVTQARTDVNNAKHTVDKGKVMQKKWTEMQQNGLGSDQSAAEAKAQNAPQRVRGRLAASGDVNQARAERAIQAVQADHDPRDVSGQSSGDRTVSLPRPDRRDPAEGD